MAWGYPFRENSWNVEAWMTCLERTRFHYRLVEEVCIGVVLPGGFSDGFVVVRHPNLLQQNNIIVCGGEVGCNGFNTDPQVGRQTAAQSPNVEGKNRQFLRHF